MPFSQIFKLKTNMLLYVIAITVKHNYSRFFFSFRSRKRTLQAASWQWIFRTHHLNGCQERTLDFSFKEFFFNYLQTLLNILQIPPTVGVFLETYKNFLNKNFISKLNCSFPPKKKYDKIVSLPVSGLVKSWYIKASDPGSIPGGNICSISWKISTHMISLSIIFIEIFLKPLHLQKLRQNIV